MEKRMAEAVLFFCFRFLCATNPGPSWEEGNASLEGYAQDYKLEFLFMNVSSAGSLLVGGSGWYPNPSTKFSQN